MKQKYLLLGLAQLVLFVLLTTSLSVLAATPNLELAPSTQSVTVGNQATINVEVEEVTNLRGANITLNFNASKLQYVSSAYGGFIPSATLMDSSANGSVTLDIAGLGATAYASGSGTIMTVIFNRIASGDTNITFGSTTLRDKDNITITHTKGTGCLLTSLVGDFNADGGVEFEDLMIFAMAYGSCEGDANWNTVCDLNADGCIEFEDLMLFAMNYGLYDEPCPPPSASTLSDPGSSLPSPATYTVSWSSVSGATSYKIQEATNSSFTSGLQEYTTSSNSRSFSHTVTTTTTYYYRVAAVDDCGQSGWSSMVDVIVSVCVLPSAPILSDPGSSLPSPATYTVSWSSVSGATGYKVQQATSPDFSGALEITKYGNSIDVSVIANVTTTYYYRVAAFNSCGQGSWSNTVDMIVVYSCPVPSAPNLSDPGSSLTSPATYTVSWSSVSGATSYKIQEATNASFTSGLQEYTTSSTSRSFSHTVTTTTTYYYRVAAVNSCGQGGWSNVVNMQINSRIAQWTVMVYMSGDQSGGSSLDSAAWLDLEEMESICSTDQVKVVAQLDPYDSCAGTYRYYVTGVNQGFSYPLYPDDIVGSLSEQDMSDPAVLANFVNWATDNYPADHYLLILWNHGGGWREEDIINKGIMWDYTPSYSYMTMEDLADGLDSFNEHIDIIGFDACLMQMIEVAYQIESWVTDAPDYMVGSEESIWGLGWNYDDILNHLTLSPTMSAVTLSETIVNDFLWNSGVTTATLSVINLSNFHSIADPIFSAFQLALSNSAYQSEIATARSSTQSYSYGSGYRCKDIYDFAERIYLSDVYDCQVEADAVMNFVDNVVVDEGWVGLSVANSHGLSIYLPDTAAEYDSAYSTLLFPVATGWGLFLQHTSPTTPTILPPTVTTLYADNITQTSARVWISIDDTGGEDPFDAGVYYGVKNKLFFSVSEIESIGSNMMKIINIADNNKRDITQIEGPISADFYFGEEEKISSSNEKIGVGTYYVTLTGLNCNTTYQYKAYAENSAGEGIGEYEDFTTLPCTIIPPTLSIGDLYDYSATEVQAYGKIESTGGENPYKAGMFIIDLTTGSDPIGWYITGDFQAGDTYYIIIPNLVSGHLYSHCAYAENSAGKGYSDWWNFIKP